MNQYWIEQETQCRDGGHLTHADSVALFNYNREVVFAVRKALNEETFYSWLEVKQIMDRGPVQPE